MSRAIGAWNSRVEEPAEIVVADPEPVGDRRGHQPAGEELLGVGDRLLPGAAPTERGLRLAAFGRGRVVPLEPVDRVPLFRGEPAVGASGETGEASHEDAESS
jgi:hypothetical protein